MGKTSTKRSRTPARQTKFPLARKLCGNLYNAHVYGEHPQMRLLTSLHMVYTGAASDRDAAQKVMLTSGLRLGFLTVEKGVVKRKPVAPVYAG